MKDFLSRVYSLLVLFIGVIVGFWAFSKKKWFLVLISFGWTLFVWFFMSLSEFKFSSLFTKKIKSDATIIPE